VFLRGHRQDCLCYCATSTPAGRVLIFGAYWFAFQWDRLQPVVFRSSGAMPCGSQDRKNCGVTTAHMQECQRHSLRPRMEMLAVRSASELDAAQKVSRNAARRLSAF
jgi:hypothetical protein